MRERKVLFQSLLFRMAKCVCIMSVGGGSPYTEANYRCVCTRGGCVCVSSCRLCAYGLSVQSVQQSHVRFSTVSATRLLTAQSRGGSGTETEASSIRRFVSIPRRVPDLTLEA